MKKLLIILFLLAFTVNSYGADLILQNVTIRDNAVYEDYCVGANCMGCWRFNEDTQTLILDTSGEDGHLTETSGTIDIVAGKEGNGRDFEVGDTEYLVHPDGLSTDISGANQTLTVVCWFKRESDSGTYEYLVDKYDTNGNQRSFYLGISNQDKGRMTICSDGSTRDSGDTSTSILTGTWYHLAGVYNDVNITMYLNGSADGSPTSWTAGIFNSNAQFLIGCREDGAGYKEYFDGIIDEVAIFDRALTASEIMDIYIHGLK